jgi:hypothetical protein
MVASCAFSGMLYAEMTSNLEGQAYHDIFSICNRKMHFKYTTIDHVKSKLLMISAIMVCAQKAFPEAIVSMFAYIGGIIVTLIKRACRI